VLQARVSLFYKLSYHRPIVLHPLEPMALSRHTVAFLTLGSVVAADQDREAFMQCESAQVVSLFLLFESMQCLQCALEKNSIEKIRFVQHVTFCCFSHLRPVFWQHPSPSPAAQQSQALLRNELSSAAMVHAADHDDRMRATR
jgi:hypothetical protein